MVPRNVNWLKSHSRKVAALLGHRLGRWEQDPTYASVSFALCDGCFAAVLVDGNPKRPHLAVTGQAYEEPCMHPFPVQESVHVHESDKPLTSQG